MKVGFTGTQKGMTKAQWAKLDELMQTVTASVTRSPVEFHHGDCVGADAEAAILAKNWGMKIVSHPPKNTSKRAFLFFYETKPEEEYLVRNKNIVNNCDFLIAMPKESRERVRSGTWSTVRYARKTGKKVTVILPNGVT